MKRTVKEVKAVKKAIKEIKKVNPCLNVKAKVVTKKIPIKNAPKAVKKKSLSLSIRSLSIRLLLKKIENQVLRWLFLTKYTAIQLPKF